MDILSKLFGGSAKVKIMRLFLSNLERVFDNTEIATRAKVALPTLRKELNDLNKIGLIKKKVHYKDSEKNKNNRAFSSPQRHKSVKSCGWILDKDFPLLAPLSNLLIKKSAFSPKEIIAKLKKGGQLTAVIVAGVFIQDKDSRVDILIVGDKLNNAYLERALSVLESEIGQELKYVILETADFKYRLGVYDKLLRDILDYSHKKIINKLGL